MISYLDIEEQPLEEDDGEEKRTKHSSASKQEIIRKLSTFKKFKNEDVEEEDLEKNQTKKLEAFSRKSCDAKHLSLD